MFVPLLTSSPDNNVPSDGHDNLRDLDEFYDGTSSAVYTNANACSMQVNILVIPTTCTSMIKINVLVSGMTHPTTLKKMKKLVFKYKTCPILHVIGYVRCVESHIQYLGRTVMVRMKVMTTMQLWWKIWLVNIHL